MAIAPLPTPPTRGDAFDADTFIQRADAFLIALPTFATEANAQAATINAVAVSTAADATTTAADVVLTAADVVSSAASAAASVASAASAASAPGTSATSNTGVNISGVGEYGPITVTTGKLFSVGQRIVLAKTSDPTNYALYGAIKSYNASTGATVLQVDSVVGSGLHTYWTLSLSPAAGASGASDLDGLTDAASDGSSVFVGAGAGAADDGTTNNNVGVGINALSSITSGVDNTAVGHSALASSATGYRNTALGFGALLSVTSGNLNVAIGNSALRMYNGSYSTAVGAGALHTALSGNYITAIGYNAGYACKGEANSFVGHIAGYSCGVGVKNTFVGQAAGYNCTDGSKNTLVGQHAGLTLTTGSSNILIGTNVQAPSNFTDGQINIGNAIHAVNAVGEGTTIPSNMRVGIGTKSPSFARLEVHSIDVERTLTLYRATSSTVAEILAVHSNVVIGPAVMAVYANGDVKNSTGVYGTVSDERLKNNIRDTSPKLDKLLSVRIRNFFLNDNPDLEQIGVIAQELEDVFPGLVSEVPETENVPDPEWVPQGEIVTEIPVVDTIDVPTVKKTINIENGVYVQREENAMETVEVPVYRDHLLYDSNGAVIGKHRVQETTQTVTPAQTEADRPMVSRKTGRMIKTVKMSIFIPILIKALQEQHELILGLVD